MAWVTIHQSIDGMKLRKLKRAGKWSKAECMGVLAVLWLWALDNCAEDGEIEDADREDLQDTLQGWVEPRHIPAMVDALISTGWIDDRDGKLYVHDWDVWQKEWYSHQRESDRKSKQYRQWRKNVLQRDNFTCVFCGAYNKKLEAHHIKDFKNHSELRFTEDNGITLCDICHRKLHSASN